MTGRFGDKVVLVAGGTGGLGRAVSLAFLNESGAVTVTYREKKEFEALKLLAGNHSASLDGFQVNLTDEDGVRELTKNILAVRGRIDVLVNTVGGYVGGPTLWETDAKTFDQMLALNLRAGYLLLRGVVPLMLKQGRGAIVNVAARAAFDHAPGIAAYAASKAAAVAMIDSVAAELRGTAVRANSILPSIIDTEANRKTMPKSDFAKWPKPEDIANVILFLCSDEARLIHGAAIPVYGTT